MLVALYTQPLARASRNLNSGRLPRPKKRPGFLRTVLDLNQSQKDRVRPPDPEFQLSAESLESRSVIFRRQGSEPGQTGESEDRCREGKREEIRCNPETGNDCAAEQCVD